MLSSCSQGKRGCSVCRDMQRRLWDSQERVRQKRGSICQGLQSVEYSSNQTLAYIGVTKEKLSSFCLQRTTCITQEKPGTVIRSQMILEFWNIWRLELSFLWATLSVLQTTTVIKISCKSLHLVLPGTQR